MSAGRALRAGWRPGGLYRLGTTAGPARYRVVRADDRPAPPALVVGLHGLGSDERQVATMLPLDADGAVYLALRAPGGLADGGFSWFDLDRDGAGRPAPAPGGVARALRHVHAFARAAQRAWRTDPARTALVGYSQGGVLALGALRDPGPFAAVASLSGGAAPAGVPLPHPAPPLFIGWGTLDPLASAAETQRTVDALGGAGVDVTACPAEAPHVVTRGQREALAAWLRARL